MKEIIVEGGRSLFGEITPQGSKNAALPIIFASVLVRGISKINNVPRISDVDVALEILKDLGAKTDISGNTLWIDTENLTYKTPKEELVLKIRASTYLIGALLGRFGVAEIMEFGGCNFDKRPIDLHIFAAEKFGASTDGNIIKTRGLRGAAVNFSKASVGATINALIMASAAEGESVITGGAREPHVFALVDFLRSAGVSIYIEDNAFRVRGAEMKKAASDVIPDMIEVGTYLLLAPLTDGEVWIKKKYADGLTSSLEVLSRAGVCVDLRENVKVYGKPKDKITVDTAAYPGYPTDLQPQIAPVMAKCFGGTIRENVWLGRFGYLSEMAKFGVKYEREDNFARIYPSAVRPAQAVATDLRGGMACLMTALSAKGKSRILNAENILRGYSDLEEKLQKLGASVKIK